jgi:hypothetical protein
MPINVPKVSDILKYQTGKYQTKIRNAISPQVSQSVSPVVQPQVTQTATPAIQNNPSPVNYTGKVQNKQDALQRYIKAKSILAKMSPQKQQVYGQLIDEVLQPQIRGLVKTQSVGDVLGNNMPVEISQYKDMPYDRFTQMYPVFKNIEQEKLSDETLGEYYKRRGMKIPDNMKQYEMIPRRDYVKIMAEEEKTVRSFLE